MYGEAVPQLMWADIEGETSRLAAARGASEHGLPAVRRDRQANLAEPQRRRLTRSSIGAADEETPTLIRRDDVRRNGARPIFVASSILSPLRAQGRLANIRVAIPRALNFSTAIERSTSR